MGLSRVHHRALMMAGCWPQNMIRMPTGESSASQNPIKTSVRYPMATKDIKSRDQQWIDIGSGIMSSTFVGADRLMTTSKGGPSFVDVHHRKIWSLSTGKLIHECDIDDVADEELHRRLPEKDNIMVEVTLRNALTLFERKGLTSQRSFRNPEYARKSAVRKSTANHSDPDGVST